ncbi:MAG: hypothetical protein ACRD0Y_14625 [Terriglobales bacterium]
MAETMIRKQLYIEPRQDRLLKRLAKERGVSEAEIVRAALDRFATEPALTREQIWAREVERMQARAAATQAAPQHPRDWTRESLYEERMRRYDRHSG